MRPHAILCAAALLAATAAPARAAFLTPGPMAASITYSTSLTTGTDVPAGGMVGQAYTDFGVDFTSAALGDVNGQTVWLPVDSPAGPAQNKLDFSAGYGGAVQVQFVQPGTSTPATVDTLSVEMAGVTAGGVLGGGGALIAFDAEGNGYVDVNPVMLSNGNVLVTLNVPGLVGFHAYKQLSNEQDPGPWGVAKINFTNTTGPNDTPEPGTIALACVGAGALAWGRLRRRRS